MAEEFDASNCKERQSGSLSPSLLLFCAEPKESLLSICEPESSGTCLDGETHCDETYLQKVQEIVHKFGFRNKDVIILEEDPLEF